VEGCAAWWAPCRAQCLAASLTDVRPMIQLSQEVEAQILTMVVVHEGFFGLAERLIMARPNAASC
jgi:hypothetical protein